MEIEIASEVASFMELISFTRKRSPLRVTVRLTRNSRARSPDKISLRTGENWHSKESASAKGL